MKISDEAKVILKEALVSNDCDCLMVTLKQSCCGTSLNFSMAKLEADEKPIFINGVSVMMDDETQARTETVTLATEDGQLIIQDSAPSCCS